MNITITLTEQGELSTPAQLGDAIRVLGADDSLRTRVDPFWNDSPREVVDLFYLGENLGTLTLTADGAVTCFVCQHVDFTEDAHAHLKTHVSLGGPVA